MRQLLAIVLSLFLLSCQSEKTEILLPAPAESGIGLKYLALGDSYTIGTAIGIENAYASKLADSLQSESYIDSVYINTIAQNGWTTGDLRQGITAAQPDSSYDLVSLLIGVNNQYQNRSRKEYRQQFRALLQCAVILAGNQKENVFVISVPDWGATPAGAGNRPAIAAQIDSFNAINRAITDSLGITYFNITPISRTAVGNPELVAKDNLHFSAQMHELWVDAIYEEVLEMVRD